MSDAIDYLSSYIEIEPVLGSQAAKALILYIKRKLHDQEEVAILESLELYDLLKPTLGKTAKLLITYIDQKAKNNSVKLDHQKKFISINFFNNH